MAKERSTTSVRNNAADTGSNEFLTNLKKYVRQLDKEHDREERYRITNLVTYCILTHFAVEEARMRLEGYPGLEMHQEDHILYTSIVVELFKKFREKGGPRRKVISCLVAFFSEHIRIHDAEFATYMTTDKEYRL